MTAQPQQQQLADASAPPPPPTTGVFLGSRTRVTRQQLRARRYQQLHRDVYLAGADAPDLETSCKGLLLAVPDAHLSHVTAGLWWKLPVDEDGTLHITRAPEAGVCRRDGVRTHRAVLHPDDVDTCREQPVTSLARTFVDLAAARTLEELVAVGDVVLRRVGAQPLQQAVARAGRRKGVVLARAALPLLDAGSASPGETRCRLLLHGAGFSGLQHAVAINDPSGNWVAEADLGDPEARVAVQYDGLVHFDGGASQWAADLARDELARAAGWEVVVLTARDLRHPHLAIAKVRAAYARAATRRAA